jgi:magnesium transporter
MMSHNSDGGAGSRGEYPEQKSEHDIETQNETSNVAPRIVVQPEERPITASKPKPIHISTNVHMNNNSTAQDSTTINVTPEKENKSKLSHEKEGIHHFLHSSSESNNLGDAGIEKDPTGGDEETLMDLMNPERKKQNRAENRSTMSDFVREEIDSLRLDLIPELGTNIEDLIQQMDLYEGVTQCLLVGLGYECRLFSSILELWTHIKNAYLKRAGKPPVNMIDLTLEEDNMHILQHPEANNVVEPVWVDIQNPTAEDMKIIQKLFSLHPLTTEDCINNDTGEKWEFFESYMFVVFTGQVVGSVNVEATTQLNIIIFEDYVLTIHEKPIMGLDIVVKRIGKEFETVMHPSMLLPHSVSQPNVTPLHNKRKRSFSSRDTSASRQSPQLPSKIPFVEGLEGARKRTVIPSSDWVLYAFLDAMVDMYIPYVDSIVQEVENLDELVFMLEESEHDDLLRRVGLTKKNIATLRRLLFPKQKMTTYLVSQDLEYLSKTIQVYMRDILDHLANAIDKLESAKENLNHTHSNYLTKVQIDIAEASIRTDDFLNRMTVIAALFVPLTLVSGIWGMNVWVPGQNIQTLEWFFGIISSLIVFSLVVIIYLRKRLVNL